MDFNPVKCLVINLLTIVVFDKLLQSFLLLTPGNIETDYKLEHLHFGEHLHSLLIKKVIDIFDVPLQEGQSLRMVSLYRLGDIDHVYFVLVVEQVVLAQICVDELALLVQQSHDGQHLQVYVRELLLGFLDLSQFGGRNAILADKIHHQYI